MATIEKRKNDCGEISYRVKVRLDGKPSATRTFTKLAPAKAWAASIETEMRNGSYAVGSGRTVGQAIDAYATKKLPGLKDARMKAVHLDWWKARIGAVKLRDLTRHAITAALDKLAEQPQAAKKKDAPARLRSGGTINRYKANFSAVLSFAVSEGWLTSNPARGIGNRKESNGRTRFLDHDERRRLLAEAKASQSADLYLAVALSLATGGRQGEVMGLRWPCVDLNKGVVTFLNTKNGSDRAVPLVPALVELLRERRRVVRLGTDLIFPGQKDPQKPIDLRQGFRAVCRRAGIVGFRWHDQRHSAASALADMGASLLDIGTVLGHRSQQTTRRYAHLTESRLRELVERAAVQHRVS